VLAEVIGFATAFDAERSGAGLARAIAASLAEAGAKTADVDHVNAQGLSTVPGDAWEAAGLRQVFGVGEPVFAPKSYWGNLGAGSGGVELAASLLALRHGELPATLNYDESDPACPVAVQRVSRPIARSTVLKVGTTELGQCAALVCRGL
jgi:3-oxoacyl-[acyl-carrier-protein] synthase II